MAFLYRSLRNWKYQITEEYSLVIDIKPKVNIKTEFISLQLDGKLTLKKYYAWDGATGVVDTKTIMRGSLVHDAMWQLIEEKQLDKSYRIQADKLFYKIIREDGMSKIRAWYIYHGLRVFSKVKDTGIV